MGVKDFCYAASAVIGGAAGAKASVSIIEPLLASYHSSNIGLDILVKMFCYGITIAGGAKLGMISVDGAEKIIKKYHIGHSQ
ncbi:MAG: hypothetical protein NT016_03300 [Candidatus Aenigmarchaeota archaeon]|nr:hypothetical protein [Candidatus Aenigmarchaeota archaeon]